MFVTCNSEHKQELQLHGCLNINEAHKKDFAGWFFDKVSLITISYSTLFMFQLFLTLANSITSKCVFETDLRNVYSARSRSHNRATISGFEVKYGRVVIPDMHCERSSVCNS